MENTCLMTFHWDIDGSMHFQLLRLRRTSYRLTVIHSTRRMRMPWCGNLMLMSLGLFSNIVLKVMRVCYRRFL
ncbi:hypothetical protein Scep_007145 [Stephania cephalantha]|uniref:Uncharacterized protein n=1 Tax=Stephania cephalantha TaxID=152367 RepID=A0AAP0PKT1_9MAGN